MTEAGDRSEGSLRKAGGASRDAGRAASAEAEKAAKTPSVDALPSKGLPEVSTRRRRFELGSSLGAVSAMAPFPSRVKGYRIVGSGGTSSSMPRECSRRPEVGVGGWERSFGFDFSRFLFPNSFERSVADLLVGMLPDDSAFPPSAAPASWLALGPPVAASRQRVGDGGTGSASSRTSSRECAAEAILLPRRLTGARKPLLLWWWPLVVAAASVEVARSSRAMLASVWRRGRWWLLLEDALRGRSSGLGWTTWASGCAASWASARPCRVAEGDLRRLPREELDAAWEEEGRERRLLGPMPCPTFESGAAVSLDLRGFRGVAAVSSDERPTPPAPLPPPMASRVPRRMALREECLGAGLEGGEALLALGCLLREVLVARLTEDAEKTEEDPEGGWRWREGLVGLFAPVSSMSLVLALL